MTQTYQMTPFNNFINHGFAHPRFVRDLDKIEEHETINRELEAQVRSGDYFISLATTLDSLSRHIDDYPTRAKIEDVVSDLIYLYDHYEIDKGPRK